MIPQWVTFLVFIFSLCMFSFITYSAYNWTTIPSMILLTILGFSSFVFYLLLISV